MPGKHLNHRGGACPQVTEDRYVRALIECITMTRVVALDATAFLGMADDRAKAFLLRLTSLDDDMEAAVFKITGVRWKLPRVPA